MKLKRRLQPKRHAAAAVIFFLAVVLIAFGAILLLNNFGLISWQVWEILWKFWPVIFILWGIEAILGKSIISGVVMGIIGILVVLFIVVYAISRADYGFNKWMGKNYPLWKNIEKNLPGGNRRDPFFECSPFDESCYRFFSN